MPINDKYKVIFIHIPKCAGTQIQNEIFTQNKHYKIRLHSSINLIKEQFKNEYNTYFKFTIVRNPYDRFISAFFYLKNNGPFDKYKLHLKDKITNNDIYSFTRELYINKELQDIIHFIPMYQFICDNQNNIIVDKIVYFENMNDDINNIFKKYNITSNFIITNTSKHKHYSEILTPELIKIINDIYDKDFEIFNYIKLNTC